MAEQGSMKVDRRRPFRQVLKAQTILTEAV